MLARLAMPSSVSFLILALRRDLFLRLQIVVILRHAELAADRYGLREFGEPNDARSNWQAARGTRNG
eukprot:13589535-Alexandrium_andersonii.AAC.1